MRKKSILLYCVFLGLGCFSFAFLLFRDVHLPRSEDCIEIPISFFPFLYKPLIKVGVQGKNYTVLLDTGSSHVLDLHKRVIEQIQDKTFVKIAPCFDVQGTKYLVSQFKIPEINIHCNLRFNNIPLHEESVEFLTKVKNPERPRNFLDRIKNQLGIILIDGSLGWPIFGQLASLFDFQNASLFLAKNLEALQKEGIFAIEDFIKVPLEMSRCGPVLTVQTELGLKKFLLDTGASHSIYRESDPESEEIVSLTLMLDGHNIGSWDFVPYPITPNLINEFDGALGIDFFKTHVICFDAQEKYTYVQKDRR